MATVCFSVLPQLFLLWNKPLGPAMLRLVYMSGLHMWRKKDSVDDEMLTHGFLFLCRLIVFFSQMKQGLLLYE